MAFISRGCGQLVTYRCEGKEKVDLNRATFLFCSHAPISFRPQLKNGAKGEMFFRFLFELQGRGNDHEAGT